MCYVWYIYCLEKKQFLILNVLHYAIEMSYLKPFVKILCLMLLFQAGGVKYSDLLGFSLERKQEGLFSFMLYMISFYIITVSLRDAVMLLQGRI